VAVVLAALAALAVVVPLDIAQAFLVVALQLGKDMLGVLV
jgi:hypothetical protein